MLREARSLAVHLSQLFSNDMALADPPAGAWALFTYGLSSNATMGAVVMDIPKRYAAQGRTRVGALLVIALLLQFVILIHALAGHGQNYKFVFQKVSCMLSNNEYYQPELHLPNLVPNPHKSEHDCLSFGDSLCIQLYRYKGRVSQQTTYDEG
jgi:hypothetical protein